MNTPSEPTTPAPGTPAQPSLAVHRVQLQEAGQTARISIHPPLDVATLAELAHLLEAWETPASLKAVVLDLTPCGGANAASESAGSKGMLESRQGRVRERAQMVAQERVLAAMQRLRAPILGVASGVVAPPGCVLLSACDLLLAAEDACFIREGGASLAYRAPPARAGTTGALPERISAHQAQRQGLVCWLAPAGQLAAETERVLALLLEKSAVALALAKRAFLLGLAQPKEPEQALAKIGDLYLRELMATADALEGLNAFLEKRQPHWQER
ncbi:MAG TPA: enoyl-CoA hydratase-related protein [Ktedonobacterales bacterium]|nr:enoyl-CoA hydratase-related protein [Ktedonobacterales bacterium]